MKTPQQLRQEEKSARDKAATLVGGRDLGELSDEETAQLDGLLDEADAAKVEREQAEAAAKRKARLDTKLDPVTFDHAPVGDPIREAERREAADIRVGKNRWEDDPNRGFKTPKDFLMKVMAADFGAVDDRLRGLAVKPMATAGSDEHGVYADVYGGFLVPSGFLAELLSVGMEDDPTVGRTRMVPMANREVSIPARTDKTHTSSVSGGLTVSRKAETVATSTSRMSLEQVKLRANTLYGAAFATDQILRESAISFAALLEAGFRDEFGSTLLNEKLRGTGVGEYEGVLTSPALVTVTKETGQAASTIVYNNLINMRARCWRYSQGIWILNHDTIPQLSTVSQPVGTGGQLVWHQDARMDVPDTLLGRPCFFSEYASALGAVGDVILCNWSEYLEGQFQPLESASSIHVRFLNHEQAFRFSMSNDGRGWWRSALTPKKSSSTLSPFVTLAARS